MVSIVALLSGAVGHTVLPLHHARLADGALLWWWRRFRRAAAVHSDQLLALQIPVDQHFGSALAGLALDQHVVARIVETGAVALPVNVAEVVESDLALETLEAVVGIGRRGVDRIDVAVRGSARFFHSVEVVAA